MKRLPFVAVLVFALCGSVQASDAYFIRFSADGRPTPAGTNIRWIDDIFFYNSGSTPATVRFIGVSNGTAQANPGALTLAPGQVILLNDTQVAQQWLPTPVPAIWVLHLDVPPGVIAESRDEFYFITNVSEAPSVPLGKISMPVFRQVVDAGVTQAHLGSDLGGQESRVNVGIFNAGAGPATAVIEVRRTCDGTVVDSRTVVVPANTVVQVGGLGVSAALPCPGTTTEPWGRYTTVAVSQPSLTFVSNLNESIVMPPSIAGAAPVVGLAVTKNERF